MDEMASAPPPSEPRPLAQVRLEPWTVDGLGLLRRLNSPEGTKFLGGPESEAKLADRNARYAARNRLSQMFHIIALPENEPAGSVGFWDKEWQGETVYETGWGVVTDFQGRGIAVAATHAVLELARADGRHRYVHAYPKIEHAASNAVCRRLGFVNLGEADFEYPAGHPIRCNDWRFDLDTLGRHPTGSDLSRAPDPAGVGSPAWYGGRWGGDDHRRPDHVRRSRLARRAPRGPDQPRLRGADAHPAGGDPTTD